MRKLYIALTFLFLLGYCSLVYGKVNYLKSVLFVKGSPDKLILSFSATPTYKVLWNQTQITFKLKSTIPASTSWLNSLPKNIVKEVYASFENDWLILKFKLFKPFNFQLIPMDTQIVTNILWKTKLKPTQVVIKGKKVITLNKQSKKELIKSSRSLELNGELKKLLSEKPNLLSKKYLKLFSDLKGIHIPFSSIKYKGIPISVDFQGADLHAVLRLLAEVGGLNIIVSNKVKGSVTLKANDVPWDLLLDAILAEYNLAEVKEGKVVRIVPISELQNYMQAYQNYVVKELNSKAAILQALQKLQQAKVNEILQELKSKASILQEIQTLQESKDILVTKTYHLKYVRVNKVVDYLKKQTFFDELKKLVKSPNQLSYDPLTNTLIIKATPKVISELDQVIKTIDKPRPEILIQARIVEISDTYLQNLGIKWGGAAWEANTHKMWGVSASPGITPPTVQYSNPSGSVSIGSTSVNIGSPTIVDLGKFNATSALGVMLGYFGETTAVLDMQLMALQEKGVGRIISKPTILTLDNEPATIQQGYKIPYLKLAANMQTATTDFIDAGLKLTVLPSLTPDGKILLDITIEKSTPDWSHTVNGVPTIITSTIQTSVIVNNGQTLVLGGVKIKDIVNSNQEVPGLAKISGLGELFKSKTKNLSDKELLVFITPKIVTYPIKGIDY